MKRRNFITSGLVIAGGMAISSIPGFSMTGGSLSSEVLNAIKRKKRLRVAHITDMHIKKGPVPEQGIKKLLDALNNLKEKPDFVLNTGDNVWDSLKHSKESTLQQWDTWNKYFRSELKYPLRNCLGNHDIWGWELKDESIRKDPDYGKTMGLKMLGLKKSYYSFDAGLWHFIILDSLTYKDGGGYYGLLGDEQMNWLSEELNEIPSGKPVCLASHIPIISPAAYFSGTKDKDFWEVSVSAMHDDAREIKDLLYKHPNVKAALSGHLHLCDHAEYLNVSYACNGAVSGAWWRGKNQEFGPAYALIDFYEDGTFDCRQIFL